MWGKKQMNETKIKISTITLLYIFVIGNRTVR